MYVYIVYALVPVFSAFHSNDIPFLNVKKYPLSTMLLCQCSDCYFL